ncbi:hypothetical protein Tco_0380901 [Tanacetum coccineum]
MSTSNTHQQSLADAGFETRPPMLERAVWERVERLMRGTIQNKVDRETRFNNEFDQFVDEPGEVLLLTEDSYDNLFDYLQQFGKLVNASRAKNVEKSYDPLALMAHPSSVVDYDDDYQGDAVPNTSDDPFTSSMILLARAITQRFSNPTNNRLRTSSITRNQAIFQGDRVNIQSKNSGNDSRNIRRSYVQEEIIEGVILTDEQNDFLFADASRMEEIEELSANICLMAIIQPANIDFDAGPSYDSAFLISESIYDDQIDSNIIFDEPNGDVNSSSVENDNNAQESYELEQLAKNAYKEAEKQQIITKKVQQQNTVLTKQLESYKEKESQSQFIRDQDTIRDLEQQHDNLDLAVVELKRQIVELQNTQTILKRRMGENEDIP